MAKKKQFDPEKLMASLSARGASEARQPPATVEPEKPAAPSAEAKTRRVPGQPRVPRKVYAKSYISLRLSDELIAALYAYQVEYRKSNPKEQGLHPGIGTAVETLLRPALKLPAL